MDDDSMAIFIWNLVEEKGSDFAIAEISIEERLLSVNTDVAEVHPTAHTG